MKWKKMKRKETKKKLEVTNGTAIIVKAKGDDDGL
jgi:hypothetical protein